MSFFSSIWHSLTGDTDRRRAREQADANRAIQLQNMKNQRLTMAMNKRAKDNELLRQQAADSRKLSALAQAQALSLRAKGIDDGIPKIRKANRNSNSGTNTGGILVQ